MRRTISPLGFFRRFVGRLILRPRGGLAGARQLFELGYQTPSAVMARAAFENHVRELCIANGCYQRRPDTSSLLHLLQVNKVIDRGTVTEMKRVLQIANGVAHGRRRERGQIANFLQGVDDFCRQHPVATD